MGKLCDIDPYARTGTIVVKSCEQRDDSSWVVLAEDDATTPFYPEGGGQPADRGTLGGKAVTDVRLEEGRVVHVVDGPLEVGSAAAVEVDWERRWDHMTSHTAQHLFSAVAARDAGAATASWELLSESVAVTLEVAALESGALFALEAAANEEIKKNRAVRVRDLSYEEAVVAAKEKEFRGALPAEGVHERVRLVEIEGLDMNACGGTHVRALGELQLLAVLRVDKDRGRVCVHLVAGQRALGRVRASLSREAALGAALSCTAGEVEGRVAQLQAERAAEGKERKRLLGELAALEGALLASAAPPNALTLHHRAGVDVAYLNALAAAFAAANGPPDAVLLLLASDDPKPAAAAKGGKKGAAGAGKEEAGPSGPGGFLVAGPAEAVKVLGPAVAAALGGQGGGRPGRFQGKAPDLAPATPSLPDLQARLAALNLNPGPPN